MRDPIHYEFFKEMVIAFLTKSSEIKNELFVFFKKNLFMLIYFIESK